MMRYSKNKSIWRWVTVPIILAMLLAACVPGATPTPAEPVKAPATEAPKPMVQTEAPPATTVEAPTAEPTQAPPTEAPTAEPTQPPAPAVVEKLRAAVVGDESTLNPYTYVTGYPGWNLLTLQYDTLFTLDLKGDPQPWLVKSYELSTDALTYTLELKDGIKWFDGKPFTAEDVKFTFEFFTAQKQSRFTRDVRGFDVATVLGDNKVAIKLKAPNPTYIFTCFADVPMLPKHIWEGLENPKEHVFESVTNIGTGPYKLVEYQPDQFYRFEANKDYFAGAPTVNELVVVKFADIAGAIAALQTKEVDMIFPRLPPEQIELLKAIEGIKIAQGPEYSTQMIVYDTQKAPFDNVAVRKAIALALNLQDMVDTVYLGTATTGNPGWIHPASPVFNDQVKTEFSVEKATALLEEAGFKDSDGDGVREYDGKPMSFELLTPSNNALRLRLAELTKEMLAKIGIQVNVSSVEQATWEQAVWPDFDVSKGRNYQMAMWGWSAPVQANPYRITELIHSDPAIGNSNLSGYKSQKADDLSNQLIAEIDPARRVQLVKDIQAVVADEVPFIVLMYPDGVYAYWATVYDNLAFMNGQGVVHKLSFLPESARP